MRDYEVKSNSIIVDFTKETGVIIPKKMIYTSGDINTSYMNITCNNNDKPIDLFRYEVNINIVRKDGSYLNAECTVVDAARGEIEVMLTTSMLYVGLNHLEVMLSMGDKQLVSPMIPYKVVTSISSDMDENIPNTNEYPILIQLIGEVKALPEKLDRELTPIIKSKIDLMNKTIQDVNQYLEHANSNETERQSNEEVRKTQELSRQESINSMTSSFNNKVGEVNAKILETTNITNENTKKIDNKIVDIQSQLDTRVTTKFTEVDGTMSTKLTQLQNQVDAKILDVDASKDNMIATVNSKIVEVDSAKTDMVSQVGNKIVDADGKIVDCENRMQVIENTFGDLVSGTGYATTQYVDTKVSGIVNSAPEALDTLKELSDALGNDPNFATTIATQIGEKANKADVYNKQYIDNVLATKEEIRLVDVKVDTNKADLLTVKNELDKSVNTKYSTVNGTKEFECKDGYVDNIHMEGKTQILDANNNPCEPGAVGAKLVSIGQGGKIEFLSYSENNIMKDVSITKGKYLNTDGVTEVVDSTCGYTDYIPIENVKYFSNFIHGLSYYDSSKSFIKYIHMNYEIPLVNNAKFIRVNVNLDKIGTYIITKGSIDKKQISTTLRSLPNGVKDELVKMGNSYYKLQKCEEFSYDGRSFKYFNYNSEIWHLQFEVDLELKSAMDITNINTISDKLKFGHSNSKGYIIYPGNSVVEVILPKNEFVDENSIKEYLKTITFVAELETSKLILLPNFNPQTFGNKTTFLLNTGVVQGECNFEVTNSLGSEIEVLKNKESTLEEGLINNLYEYQSHQITDNYGNCFMKSGVDLDTQFKTINILGNNFVNAPNLNYAIVEVISGDNNITKQIFTETTNNIMYVRMFRSKAWTPWKKITTTSTLESMEYRLEEQANKISILEVENVNLLESQKVQDRTIVENDMRMMDLEWILEDLITSTNPIVLKHSETRSEVYFNQLSQMIKMENYDSKEDMKRILDKYLKGKRITQEEYDRLYNMLYNHA